MQCSVSLFCLHHFNALSHPSQDDEIWIQQNLWITQLCLQMILVQLYWQVSLAGWVKYCLWMVLRFKSFKCVLCMAWVYEVGLGSLCWPAAKVTIITVMSVRNLDVMEVALWHHQSSPDVSVRVGSAKVTIIMVTSSGNPDVMLSTSTQYKLWGQYCST